MVPAMGFAIAAVGTALTCAIVRAFLLGIDSLTALFAASAFIVLCCLAYARAEDRKARLSSLDQLSPSGLSSDKPEFGKRTVSSRKLIGQIPPPKS